jgi:hypothetical protein
VCSYLRNFAVSTESLFRRSEALFAISATFIFIYKHVIKKDNVRECQDVGVSAADQAFKELLRAT